MVKDLSNQRFGRLTALWPLDEKRSGRTVWHCRCDCGNEADVTVSNLLRGTTKSCGCLSPRRDLTGQRFGSLTVLGPTEKRQGGRILWHCACDCGNVRDVVTSYLVKTPDISCGCRNRNAAADLTGRRFGELTVEGPAQRRQYWRVRCACGAQKEIRGDSLIQGRARTCGARCHQYQDVTGQRRGHLTAVEPTGRLEGGSPVWLWRCDCGAEMEATLQSVPSRHNRMCPACLKKRNQGIIVLAFQRKQALAINGLAPTAIRHILEGKLTASNTSGIRGVCLDQRTGKWIASGRENGKNVSLGHFDTAAEAECVRRQFVEEKYARPVLQCVAAGHAAAEAFGDFFQLVEKTE